MGPSHGAIHANQPHEVMNIPSYEHAAFPSRRQPQGSIRGAAEIWALGDRYDIVSSSAELRGDHGSDVLVEEKPHASRETCWRYNASSRSASSRLAAIQSSISSGYAA